MSHQIRAAVSERAEARNVGRDGNGRARRGNAGLVQTHGNPAPAAVWLIALCLVLVPAAKPAGAGAGHQVSSPAIAIDYPLEGSIFPPEFTAPTFLWRDQNEQATEWRIEVTFSDGARALHFRSAGERMRIGEIDPRCVAATNQLPELTPQQAAAHTWTPDAGTWATMKQHSVNAAAIVTIAESTSSTDAGARVSFTTSKDRVGAPIFYRDVPLMPSQNQKGVIKPLDAAAVPLIAWRLRNIGETSSRVLLTGMHTCANCHSFSLDGKTLGMDLDGPQNDKGLYALAPIGKEMSIGSKDVIAWNPPGQKEPALERVGFMSQVSPNGEYVLTSLSGRTGSQASSYYVVNFKDYRFLQVFYPTRGILAWYSRAAGRRQPLPGADDTRYVQTDGVWSPDGKWVVYARAEARDPEPAGGKMAERANDPSELPIQYDLYRVPFNDGRGGTPQPIEGASANGMSNTFPKVSPDGRWIVFVQCRNGQLMRPDSKLYIVPAQGGQARRMRANTALMNSWHSFSPNGRWLVFSSKSQSPYTQMFLTHIDEDGNDSPAILIENSTAANRAVNIPEFVNIPPDGLTKIEVPAVDFYRQFDRAYELSLKGDYTQAIPEWRKALDLNPDDVKTLTNLGNSLEGAGRMDEALPYFRKVLEMAPDSPYSHSHLGDELVRKGDYQKAIPLLRQAVAVDPRDAKAQGNLGIALARAGRPDEALPYLEKASELNPGDATLNSNLGEALAERGRTDEAIGHLERALEIGPDSAKGRFNLGAVYASRGRLADALTAWRRALELDPNYVRALDQSAQLLAAGPDATLRDGAKAVELAEKAVRLTGGQEAETLGTLASAYAEANRFPDALSAARRALELALEHHNAQQAERLRARIVLFEAAKPFRSGLPVVTAARP